MLPDPGFTKAGLIGQNDLFDVPVVGIGEGAIGRVQRHHEQAELHVGLLVA